MRANQPAVSDGGHEAHDTATVCTGPLHMSTRGPTACRTPLHATFEPPRRLWHAATGHDMHTRRGSNAETLAAKHGPR